MNDLDGATTLPDESTMPASPGEFAALWNERTDAQRQVWLTAMQKVQSDGLRCFVLNHEGRLEQYEQAHHLTTREAALAAMAAETAAKDLEHSTLATRYAGLVSEFRALVTKLRTPTTAPTTEERTR